MNSIDSQTKLLLKGVNWKNPHSFEGLGYIYFGPLLFNYFAWLKSEIGDSDKILFNSREGRFLQEIYELFRVKFNLPESVYFKTSRRLSSLVSLFNTEDIYKTFDLHRYNGTLSTLLNDRFGISNIQNDVEVDTEVALPNLDLYLKEILQNSKKVRKAYQKYILDVLGNSKNVIMVDSGYQGTTQYNIEKTYGLKFKGRYIIYKETHLLENVKGFYNFESGQLKDNLIFLECIFNDNIGSYINISDNTFITEQLDETKNYFDEKIEIINGIKKFIIDMLDSNINLADISNEISDSIFNLMCTPNYIKNDSLFDIFYHDNRYVRGNLKKIDRTHK